MRKLFCILLATVAVAGLAVAGDKFVIELEGLTNQVLATKTSDKVSGYIEAIFVDVPTYNTYVGTVRIATEQNEIILTNAVSTNTIPMFRPRVPICLNTGVTVTGEPYTNSLTRYFLENEKITASIRCVTTNKPTTEHTVPITIWLDNK